MQGKRCTAADCHDSLQAKKLPHGPVALGDCGVCHVQPKPQTHVFELTHGPDEHCQSCHVMKMKNFTHRRARHVKCTGCHDPHQSDHRFLLRGDPAKDLCLICHKDDAFMGRKHLHGPVAAGACLLCHEPHSAWNPKLLVKRARDLCLSCHEEMDRRLTEARHVHPPVREDCGACHDPHGSDHKMQMRDGKRKACLGCHKELASLITTSKHVHAAISDADGCGNCHDIHAAPHPRLLKTPPLDTCLNCHNKEIELPDGEKLPDIAGLLEENRYRHGPLRRADCSVCHNPHASPNFRLLNETYSEAWGAPFDPGDYDLCFQCHLRDMILVKHGRGLTRFKHGMLNLHFVHVNREADGQTCRGCHEAHASKNPVHIREKAPFDPRNRQLDMSFQKTETGGRCTTSCHDPEEYIRNPGDLPALQSRKVPATVPARSNPGAAGSNGTDSRSAPKPASP